MQPIGVSSETRARSARSRAALMYFSLAADHVFRNGCAGINGLVNVVVMVVAGISSAISLFSIAVIAGLSV